MKYIKQFGLQRSGTNAIKALIEVNFKETVVLQDYLGNKHEQTSWAVLEEDAFAQHPKDFGLSGVDNQQVIDLIKNRDLPVVINIKDPVSWVNSYYKYQLQKTLFRNPDAVLRFNVQFAQKVLSAWEKNVVSWLEFHEQHRKSIVFLHEEVVCGLSRQLETLRVRFDLEVSEQYPTETLDGYARRGTDQHHGEELINQRMKFDRDYHLLGGWKKEVPENVRLFLFKYSSDFVDKNPQFRKYFKYNIIKEHPSGEVLRAMPLA